ncbi:MAG: glycosyltransferase family 4 protein [Gemmatimonadetes bacterium]|nr:glycosyltransferase family 4 protein [Gemmatimonadota bacterium]
MKIAIVGLYPKDPDRIRGGVEAVTLRLSRGLARRDGTEVHVVVSEPDREIGEHVTDEGVTVHSVGSPRRFGNVTFQRPARALIAQALRRIAPDVVHAHSAHREALGAVESGLPAVVTIHGLIEREIALETKFARRWRGVFRRRVMDLAFEKMRNAIVLGPLVQEHYRKELAHARVWVIENPVDDLFFTAEGPAQPDTLIYSGYLIPRKGIRNLLNALDIVRRKRPAARLRLAGLAPLPDYEGQVHDHVKKLGLEDAVDFLGSLSPAQLAAEYAGAAGMLLVSKQETLPVAIQEAMAAGLPVIASPVGGVPHLVDDGGNGFLVPWGDPEQLADRWLQLLEDDALRERLGASARRTAEERFRLDRVCERTLEVYREVIAGHGSGAPA